MSITELSERKRRAKDDLIAQGISIADFARANGFKDHAVYNVLNNPEVQCKRGTAHRIAVALGIKAPPRLKQKIAA